MKCRRCKAPAVIDIRRHNAAFCGDCFLHHTREQVRRAIDEFDMIEPGERVLVAVSGGKVVAVDSPDNLTARLRGSEKLFVQVDAMGADAQARLSVVPGVTRVAPAEAGSQPGAFEIESEHGRDVRRDLAAAVVGSGWGLLSKTNHVVLRGRDPVYRSLRELAMSYFHMATCHTIIGAKRFHFRVRDGIGWFTLAMFTKQIGLAVLLSPPSQVFRPYGNLYSLAGSAFYQLPKRIGCYMVKPHGSLVHVSYAHYWTSTSCLSTL